MNICKSVLSVMIAGAGFVGMAHAGTLIGNAATASADLVFTTPSELTNTLTAVSGLSAGSVKENTLLAQGKLATTNGGGNRYAVRVMNGEVNPNYDDGMKIISGNNDGENKLSVYVSIDGAGGFKTEVIDGIVYTVGSNVSSGNYSVNTFGNNAVNGGKITADTYTVQTEAYVYNL
ncbi:hypothetical protein AAGR22_05395 [Erwinia sp. HDF1-3R]|uniref:hypothetical protein n=1 Tax=Erwinia sp. HDF1-3R TaxID=3141543 RepID=UPI0031F5CB4F